MISWRNLPLQFLCWFVFRLPLTDAGCFEYLNPEYWEKTPTSKITIRNLTERIPLVDADSFKDVINCTLGNEMKKGRYVDHLLRECMEYKGDIETLMDSLKCGKELQSVSFFDFMCLVAKASDMHDEIQACSHDVVIELYLRFRETPITTAFPTTKQPPTTTKLTTTTAKSSTAEKSPKTSSPPLTTWSTRPSTSSTASQSPAGDASSHTDYNKLQSNIEVSYALFGLSVLVNMVLAFFVVVLCSRRQSNSGTQVNSAADMNVRENLML